MRNFEIETIQNNTTTNKKIVKKQLELKPKTIN